MDLRQIAEGEVQRALQGGGPVETPATPLVGYAPVYAPGTADPAQALSIRLITGEERAGANIRIDPVPTARIEAVPNVPDTANPASLQVFLVAAQPVPGTSAMAPGRRGPDGHFIYAGVTPGSYTLIARAAALGGATGAGNPTTPPVSPTNPAARGRGPAAPLTFYATVDLVVDGHDLTVPLDIQQGMTVSGRVVFDGDPARMPKDSPISIALSQAREGVSLGVPSGPVDAAGAFRLVGAPPGRYRLSYSGRALDPWTLMSATARNAEVLDTLLDVRAGEDVSDLVVTFTDRVSELSGRLETAAGHAAPDFFIIAFAADRSFWTPQSRRVRQVRPGNDGRFSVRGLPAGDYFVAALTDVVPGEWFDPAFLAQLVSAAVTVTIRNGEQTVQDLRIR
jgi:hypothetical protein